MNADETADSPLFEPGFQLRPASRQPALNGSQRAMQVRGGLVLGQALEVTEDQWLAERFGQDAQLVVQLGPVVVVLDRFEIRVDGLLCRFSSLPLGARGCGAGTAAVRALAATRRATPCSQHPTDSRRLIDPARRARTRNVACAASSASSSRARIWRQTRKTIAPCRSTSAAKAASATSSRRSRKCSSNCPSVKPPDVPVRKSVSICLRSCIGGLTGMRTGLAP